MSEETSLKRFAAKLSNSIPSDLRIAGEVQAIGGKGMKMREKKVVTVYVSGSGRL
jgi:hypothetical protein